MLFHPTKPYNDLPDLPPPVEVETKAVLKACIEARAALARLNAEAQLLPNPSILINSITLLEAKDSSEIENIVTTEDELFRQAQLGDARGDPATKEALRYRTALFEGFESLAERPICTATAVRICRTLKGADIDVRKTPGTTLKNDMTGEVIYTPPIGEDVLRSKLANWERFIHEATGLDPLVRLAIQHYQFEAIHPFSDGNGRTGRVLNILFLIEQKLLALPIIYLSREILKTRNDYYDGLLSVTRDQDWEGWISYVLELITWSAVHSSTRVWQLRALMLHTEVYLRQRAPKIFSRELSDVLFQQPYCRISDLVSAGIAKRQTASTYLKSLVALGILSEIQIGTEKFFVHTKLRQLLANEEHRIMEYSSNALAPPALLFPPTPTAQSA